jgi:hypothetical protein
LVEAGAYSVDASSNRGVGRTRFRATLVAACIAAAPIGSAPLASAEPVCASGHCAPAPSQTPSYQHGYNSEHGFYADPKNRNFLKNEAQASVSFAVAVLILVGGWRNLRLLSSRNNTFNRDYHGETPEGEQLPVLNVFSRDEDGIHHRWASELTFVRGSPLDPIWPIWGVLDLTPNGRGETAAYPSLQYE